MLMQYLYKNNDNVSLCFKDACINAVGNNAKLITAGVLIVLFTMTLLNLSKIK